MARRTWLLAPSLIALLLLAASTVSAEVPVRKIVVFKEGVADATKQVAIGATGGKTIKQLGLVNATAAELTPASALALSRRPDVLRVEDDSIMRENAVVATPGQAVDPRQSAGRAKDIGQAVPWGVARIDAPGAWRISNGKGVKVAILDSGIDLSHPDLKVAGGVNEVSPGKSYTDDRGHGTHVAGVIAALDNTAGVVGVAPAAELYAVKVLDKNGSALISNVIAGLDWAVNHGMRVVNMSFGSPVDSPSIHEAVSKTYAAGVVMVASAGNSGPSTGSVHYPAAYPEVLAVSAIDQSDKIASWSSRGPQVAVTAPGVDIYSTYIGGGYATMSGTSMAAPHVTGAVALRLQQHPGETPREIAAALKNTADRLRGLTTDEQGAGLVDARRLVTAR